MDVGPVKSFMQLFTQGTDKPTEKETILSKTMKFAEESTFFFGFFKNRSVKHLPDQTLLMQLYKSKLKNKKRKVTKKSEPSNLYMRNRRKQNEEDQEHKDQPED
ncbi:hypothetical protein EOPP23_03580 [Endozoicomonas sp. OPT23]|uniref:hypothetical protein n=1 Tax=Endozoicomonas sp. OPT23 TaxID=2072845 RepID=UPI00129AF6B4|nr:hypothetical protein [Endozoicomonas sp. OPT23]MRI32081.1 hypothetical protein [Endozoicomonas sp. OPT23]